MRVCACVEALEALLALDVLAVTLLGLELYGAVLLHDTFRKAQNYHQLTASRLVSIYNMIQITVLQICNVFRKLLNIIGYGNAEPQNQTDIST